MKEVVCFFIVLMILPTYLLAEDVTRAWITATQEGRFVTLETFALLEPGADGTYDLVATKEGESGRSVSRQAGRVPLSHGEKSGLLSVSRISVETGAVLIVELKVVSDNGQVYQDKVSVFGK